MTAPGAIVDTSRDPVQWPAPDRFQSIAVNGLYFNTDGVNPADVLGYGTWALFAAGTTLVAFKAGDPDFGVAGAAVGHKNIPDLVHAGTAVATHADHTHNVTSNVTAGTTVATAGAVTVVDSITNGTATSSGASAPLTHTVTQPNNHLAASMSVIQPSTVVYFWLRTA